VRAREKIVQKEEGRRMKGFLLAFMSLPFSSHFFEGYHLLFHSPSSEFKFN
jgi:hypothetical protein